MEKMFTRDLLCLEQEAGKWLEFFDNIPDDNFEHCKIAVDAVTKRVKAFARVYQSFTIEGRDSGYIIN